MVLDKQQGWLALVVTQHGFDALKQLITQFLGSDMVTDLRVKTNQHQG